MHFITLFYFISQHPNGSSILIGFPSEAHYFAFSTIQVFKNANHYLLIYFDYCVSPPTKIQVF